MTQFPAILVTLELGAVTRTVTGAELARALSTAPIDQALVELVLGEAHPQSIPKRRGTIGGGDSKLPGNERERFFKNRFRSFAQEEKNLQVGEGQRTPAADNPADRLASFLADRFDDWKSYGFFLQVSRTLPEHTVRDLLTRALDVPERNIRRSRAALFTALAQKAMAESQCPSTSSSPN